MKFEAVGIKDFSKYVSTYGKVAEQAALLAVNDSLRKGRTLIAEDMRNQVALSRGYINQRLTVKQFASPAKAFGVISGVDRPVSLNRFLLNPAEMMRHKPGVSARVSVKPNSAASITNAFTIRLKGGNLGLAKRVPGDPTSLDKSKGAKRIGKGLFLLYGPSLTQVMSGTLERRDHIQTGIGSNLQYEFIRQLRRLSNG